MIETKKPVIILSIILITSVVIFYEFENQSYVILNGEKIFVEVAKTPEARERGLMFREELCGNCGMIFIFEEENFPNFWMKNTIIHLDIIFINSEWEVVDIFHVLPCTEDPCENYIPREKSLYVLETNAGKFDKNIIGKKIKAFL